MILHLPNFTLFFSVTIAKKKKPYLPERVEKYRSYTNSRIEFKIFITTFFLSFSCLYWQRNEEQLMRATPTSSQKHAAKKKNEHDFRTNIIKALELNNFLVEEIHLLWSSEVQTTQLWGRDYHSHIHEIVDGSLRASSLLTRWTQPKPLFNQWQRTLELLVQMVGRDHSSHFLECPLRGTWLSTCLATSPTL
jgi:hypothetical protein